jgi:hypothetical protein
LIEVVGQVIEVAGRVIEVAGRVVEGPKELDPVG